MVPSALRLWLFTIRGLKMYHWIQAVLRRDEQTTLYAYWMSYDGFAAALCKRKDSHVRAIARAHAFDIDIQRNPLNPYLMKRFMARTLDGMYPISRYAQDSTAFVHGHSSGISSSSSVRALPPGRMEKAFRLPRVRDGVFRLVSCAAMIEIKQIPLLIDALAGWQGGKLHWTHIGGGEDERMQFERMRRKMLDRNGMVTYSFTGALLPEQVRGLYAEQSFDAFINTSRSEGIPVTIMEALHAGIPVVAPAIGGIPELVDGSVGCLYELDGGVDAVIAAIRSIYDQSAEETEHMHMAAQACWRERCAIDTLLPQLFPAETEEAAQQ